MELNRLTQDLYAEGYTREQHPNFVYWSNWQNFGYPTGISPSILPVPLHRPVL